VVLVRRPGQIDACAAEVRQLALYNARRHSPRQRDQHDDAILSGE
jgi:hypothetical protein